jgi:ribosomal protein S18 acetylase RimI-like enzyme
MPLEVYEQRQLRGENFGYFVGDALAVIVSLARQESADWREETGGQTHWWLKTLATAEEFHGRRLGEQTVAACEMWLRERGEKKLLLDCADAGFLPHFYTRLGFQVVARKSIAYPSGDASAMVLMENTNMVE